MARQRTLEDGRSGHTLWRCAIDRGIYSVCRNREKNVRRARSGSRAGRAAGLARRTIGGKGQLSYWHEYGLYRTGRCRRRRGRRRSAYRDRRADKAVGGQPARAARRQISARAAECRTTVFRTNGRRGHAGRNRRRDAIGRCRNCRDVGGNAESERRQGLELWLAGTGCSDRHTISNRGRRHTRDAFCAFAISTRRAAQRTRVGRSLFGGRSNGSACRSRIFRSAGWYDRDGHASHAVRSIRGRTGREGEDPDSTIVERRTQFDDQSAVYADCC